MNRIPHFVSVILISAMLFGLTGCPFKKKKPPVPQPSAQAPTVESQPAQPATAEPPAAQPKEEEKPQPVEATPAPKPKPKHKVVHKEAPPAKAEEKPQQATATPPRIVIQEGGAKEPNGQISTVTGHDQTSHQRMTTAQLLDSTEANLRKLNRTLTAEEQATVSQIKDYVEQARAATAQQDLVRAHNLALKAHLLSDDLVNR